MESTRLRLSRLTESFSKWKNKKKKIQNKWKFKNFRKRGEFKSYTHVRRFKTGRLKKTPENSSGVSFFFFSIDFPLLKQKNKRKNDTLQYRSNSDVYDNYSYDEGVVTNTHCDNIRKNISRHFYSAYTAWIRFWHFRS